MKGDPRFESLAELYDGIEEYHNFMTEKEARSVVDKIVMFDGREEQSGTWTPLLKEVKKVGGVIEEKHHFNKWVLCHEQYADYGGLKLDHSRIQVYVLKLMTRRRESIRRVVE